MANEKILVVDDDKNICELLRLYLVKEGYSVTMAHDGEAALTDFDKLHPDLVLLDVMMPVMDGWEVCRKIRAKDNTPIIMLTAKGETYDKVLGLELGADDYIVKPFDQLLDEVWGFEYYGDSRTIDVHVKRLREKLEGASEQWNLKTVWGVGYKFEVKE